MALDELEHKVQERTSELRRINQELLQAKQAAEHTSHAKSDILSNTSHELRTPLNSLLLLAELLTANSEKNLSDKEVNYAVTILEAARDLLSSVNDLLDLAQIESGRPSAVSLDDTNWDRLQDILLNGFVELANKKKLQYNGLPEVCALPHCPLAHFEHMLKLYIQVAALLPFSSWQRPWRW